MIDPRSDRALYRQIADHYRSRIAAGEIRPGESLPSEGHIAGELGVSRACVRRAIAVLRAEGLIRTHHGKRAYVPARVPARYVALDDAYGDARILGAMVTARMPSDIERRDLGIADGVPVLVVRRLLQRDGLTDEVEELHPADRVVLTYQGP